MPKNYNLKELILESLDGRELSKKTLLEDIRKVSERSTSDKTLNESLMSLLKEKKIYITNYDFSIYEDVKRIQSIKPDGIVFGLMKTDFVEIETLIKQLESNDSNEVRNASSKLKRNFRNKNRGFEIPRFISNGGGCRYIIQQNNLLHLLPARGSKKNSY